MSSENTHIAVIGGGCAGLSAAARLSELGYPVSIFEASSQFGGRARMVMVENNREMTMLDNGQHILLGAYRETLALLKKMGVDEEKAFLRMPLHLHMVSTLVDQPFKLYPNKRFSPALDLLIAVFQAEGLQFCDKLNIARLLIAIRKINFQLKKDVPLNVFLDYYDQTARAIKALWVPLCLAALNTSPKNASAQIFLNVLRDSFTGGKGSSDFLLPKLDLSQIISNPLSQYIYAMGGKLNLNHRVRGIEVELDIEGNEHFKIETKHGFQYFSHVVMAVSPARLDKLVAKLPRLSPTITQLKSLTYQPIYTVYIQYPKETTLPDIMTGFIDSITQWAFDRGELCQQKGLISVIISAEGTHQLMEQDALALRVISELKQAFPHLPKPLWYKVIAEKRATFTCAPNLKRPGNKTLQPRFYLAGDYTYADYPATIEGAIRSGIRCADLIDEFENLELTLEDEF